MIVLPLPSGRQALVSRLQQNEVDGLRLIANVARNPFQRNVAQSALLGHLHDYAKPLDFLYELLTNDELNEYAFVPVTRLDWERLGTQRDLLLGELAGERVDTDRIGHRVVWGLTRFLRDPRETRLTRFAGLLYDLMDKKKVVAPDFNLSSYEPAYMGVRDYPGGVEIAGSFELLATFLSYNTLSALSSATALTSDLTADEAAIRRSVLKGLAQLGQVGKEVAAYQASTSRVNKLAALARASDILNKLDKEVVAEVMVPEQTILRRIIRQWGGLISKAGGEVGRAEEIGPVANPYVAGNPVTGELFVGREEIMRRLEELWGAVEVPSVVLYGHRRMGKSSILRNFGARFGTNATVVDFNMQRVGHVANTGELLHNLSLALYDGLPPVQQEELGEPEEERFLKHNPYTAFDRFLKQLDRLRADQRFIITVDEFELIEVAISEGQLEARLLDFWRGLIQTYPWFVMAFAGLHTLREMTQDYWHPLFGSVTTIPVSFIRPKAARRLIIQPTADFPLDYDEEAIAQIITLTSGQPYLIQLICHALVTRFNRQTFEEGVARERRLSIADLEAVINAAEFYRDGHFYFIGVWGQAETGIPDTQTTVLRALAPSETALPAATIAQRAELPLGEAWGALKALETHDVLKEEHGRWRFTVELMRRWVVEKKIGAS
ncbi:MAG: AAA family ATPase [Ardenticatenaceae bacterium]